MHALLPQKGLTRALSLSLKITTFSTVAKRKDRG
jgi:hypothetical protein